MAHPIVYVSVQSTGIRGDVGQRARCAVRGRWAHTERRPTTSTGLPVEDQVRKEWDPRKGGLPTF